MMGHVQPQPYQYYENELYIYPVALNFNNYSNGKLQARTIGIYFSLSLSLSLSLSFGHRPLTPSSFAAIHAKYMPNDLNPSEKCLPVSGCICS